MSRHRTDRTELHAGFAVPIAVTGWRAIFNRGADFSIQHGMECPYDGLRVGKLRGYADDIYAHFRHGHRLIQEVARNTGLQLNAVDGKQAFLLLGEQRPPLRITDAAQFTGILTDVIRAGGETAG